MRAVAEDRHLVADAGDASTERRARFWLGIARSTCHRRRRGLDIQGRVGRADIDGADDAAELDLVGSAHDQP
jgi:hypothetical protein